MYRYSIKLKKTNGLDSDGGFSQLSGPVEIKSETDSNDGLNEGNGAKIFGDFTIGISSNTVSITLSNVNSDIYKYADIIAVRYGGTVNGYATDGYIFKNASIGSSIFNFTHYDNTLMESLPISEIIALLEDTTANIAKAKNLRIANNRLVLANITKDTYSDLLTNWAKSITVVDQLKEISALNLNWNKHRPADSTLHDNVAEYYSPENRAENMGYMPFEEYRFGVQVKFKNGGWSDTFHIKDHRFDQGADTGPIDVSKYDIEFETVGSTRIIKYGSLAISNGRSFIEDGFVKGMYIAIQDEYNGQTQAQTQAYYSSNTAIPVSTGSTDGIEAISSSALNDSGWYINGNTIDFRRRIWYGNNGGANDLGTPYFKIQEVTDTQIKLSNSVGNFFNAVTNLPNANTADKRRRVCSIYPPQISTDKFNHLKYAGNHPMVRDGKVGVLAPKFSVDLTPVADIISGYRIVRAPVIKEVLASGMCVVAENDRDCDAGLAYYKTQKEGKNFFYPTYTSNSWSQRFFTHGFAHNSDYYNNNTYSGLDSYTSPVFNNATVNNNISTAYHIKGDGTTHKVKSGLSYISTSSGVETDVYRSYSVNETLSTNRPHPCVLSESDFNDDYNGYNASNAFEFSEVVAASYTPHRYSGRNVVYFHAPDFDANMTDGGKGYEQDWRTHSGKDMLINLGRVYHGQQPIGPTQGSFKDTSGNELGSGLAFEEDPNVLKKRRILTANTGFPFVDVKGSSESYISTESAQLTFQGLNPTTDSQGVNLSGGQLHDVEKSVDAQVIYCNRIPYIPMYGESAPLQYDAQGQFATAAYKPSMMQPGLQHNTFKHWTFYKIDDAQHTDSISDANTNDNHPARVDTVNLYSSRLGNINIHSSISYGSGNNHDGIAATKDISLIGAGPGSETQPYDKARRVDLANTSSLPMLQTMLMDNVDDDAKSMVSCRTPKCMIMTVANKHQTPTSSEFAFVSNDVSIQDAAKPTINAGQIGLTDGGGRKRVTADRGNKRTHAGENCFEQNIHHNWAGFADRGQNAQNVAPATTASHLGAYGWNKMSDETGMYMGLYFRQKSTYGNGDINHSGGKLWSADASKYGNLQHTEYVSTGHFRRVTDDTHLIQEDLVMGGDTMCQRTYVKISGSPVISSLITASYDVDGNQTQADGQVTIHPYRNREVDYNGDGTTNDFSLNPKSQQLSPDMHANAVAIMYSFNRINSQSRTKNPSENGWTVTHKNPGFPFGSSLGNYLYHRSSIHNNKKIQYLSTLTGGGYWGDAPFNLSNLPNNTLESRLSTTLNGHQSAETASVMGGFDKYLINNCYLLNRGQFVIAYANNNATTHRQNLATRIYYSLLKDANSPTDAYREFSEFNHKDLDVIYGPINNIELLNGDLYAWQPEAMSRLFMLGTTAITGTESETEILLSQDNIFSKKEKVITNYGTSEKWSVSLGRTKEGLSVCVWVDENKKKIIRFDEKQSVAVLSDLFGVSEPLNVFCNTMGDYNLSNPVGVGGVHTVWDEANGEFVFTWKYNFDGVNSNIITYLTDDDTTATFGADTEVDYEIGAGADDPVGQFDVGEIESDFEDVIATEDNILEDNDFLTLTDVFDDIIQDNNDNVDIIDEAIDDDNVPNPHGDGPLTDFDEEQPDDVVDEGVLDDSNTDVEDVIWPDDELISNEGTDEDLDEVSGVITSTDEIAAYAATLLTDRVISDIVYNASFEYASVTERLVRAVAAEYIDQSGAIVGNRFTIKEFIEYLSRYLQSNNKPANKRSKQPVHRSSTKTARPKSSLRNIIETYTSKTAIGDFNRAITKTSTTGAGSTRNSFNDTGSTRFPSSIADVLFHFDFTRRSSCYLENGKMPVATANDEKIITINGIESNKLFGPSIFSNSTFSYGSKYWDSYVQHATATVKFITDSNVCRLTSPDATKYAGIRASKSVSASGRIIFTSSPAAGSTIEIISTTGVKIKYKAVDQTTAGAVDLTVTGVYDASDNTVKYERGDEETGTPFQKSMAATALSKAIESREAHRGAIKARITSGGTSGQCLIFQAVPGVSGNTTLTGTGTTNATLTSFAGGTSTHGSGMPGFTTNSRNVSSNTTITPFAQYNTYRVDLHFNLDKSTYGSCEIYFVESPTNHTTKYVRLLSTDITNGFNTITRYISTVNANPDIGVFVVNGVVNISKFQIRKVLNKQLHATDVTNANLFNFRQIVGGNALQTVNAAAGKFAYNGGLTYVNYESRPALNLSESRDWKSGHTIAFVVNNNGSNSTRNIFGVGRVGSTPDFWTFRGHSSNTRYEIVNNSGSSLADLTNTKRGNHITSQITAHVGGEDNIIVMKFASNSYTVYQNGHMLSTASFATDYSTHTPVLRFYSDSSGASTAPCVKEMIVFKKALTDNEIVNIKSYLANKYNSALHLDLTGGGALSAGWNSLYSFTNLSANAFLSPTGTQISKFKKEVLVGDTIIVANGSATGDGATDSFTDSTSLSSDSANIYAVARAYVKVIQFAGGSEGQTNGIDAFTMRLTPSGTGVSEIVYVSAKAIPAILDTAQTADITSNTYLLETTFLYTKASALLVKLEAFRANTASTNATIHYEIANTNVVKAIKYNIGSSLNNKPVLAKVFKSANGYGGTVTLWKRNATTLTGVATSLANMATATLQPAQSAHWTQISTVNVNNGNWARLTSRADDTTDTFEDLEAVAEMFTNATLSWSEFRKKFVSYYSQTPNLYLPFKDYYLSYDKDYTATSGMNLWTHNTSEAILGTFYGISEKSSIFIPLNEVKENQKTLYNVLLEGTISNTTDITASIVAVNPLGSDYKLIDSEVVCTIDRKDDYYTLTPQSRIHGKAFAIKIETVASTSAYIKINSVIVRCRAEGPTRNLLSKQNPLKGLTKKK